MDNNWGQDEPQLAHTLQAAKLSYKAIDYSECHIRLMRRKHDTVLAMRDELERDGLVEHVQRMLCESFDETVNIDSFHSNHCGLRYLYTARKPD